MNSEHSLEWQFGGWPGLPPWLGWLLLFLVAAGGAALAVWFYRDTFRALTGRQRLIFAVLRCGFFFSLLLCLAGPARVEKLYDSNRDARPLAVVVDRSPSMSIAEPRGTTRLSYAVRVWKKVEADAIHSFPSLAYFRFSMGLEAAPDLESAVTGSNSGAETHLYDSLEQALKDAPAGGYGGIVCLTDGLDTTDATSDQLAARALQNHTPLYFAVGQNQLLPHDSLLVRELAVPGQVLRKSRFTATVLVEAHSTRERDVPVSLWQENQSIAQTSLRLLPGNNLIPWAVPVDAGEPGLVHLDCRLGDGADQETTAAVVPVVGQDKVQILFYQGTLDWGFRFINSALQGDPSFALTGLFNPNLNMTQVTGGSPASVLTAMPDKGEDLQPFQIVVLSNVFGDELSPAQQTALVNYVNGGGGLLFLVSDNQMAQTFSGTVLESVLPVVFEAPPVVQSHDQSVQQFQDLMQSIGGSNASQETEFVSDAEQQPGPDPLVKYALPPNLKRPEIANLFSPGPGGTIQNVPEFEHYARVHRVKAGGEVLAVHPEDKNAANEPRALLVTQRFGQGRVTALLTDALWRWRLSLPSTSHDPEVFWQQLFLALAHLESNQTGLRFGLQPFFSSLGQVCSFRLDGAHGANAPTFTAISPGGQLQPLSAQSGSEDGSWSFQFSPNAPGTWRIRARDGRGSVMETLLRVSSASHTAELSGLPPDTDGLRKLAESTGGALLNDGVPDNWSASNAPDLTTLVSRHSQPLWNNWVVLLIGLGFYATELIWRRSAKLL
ncbi:MAG: hypothetical protein LV480_03680 [Methylacidiphilales bacterium]|nr:hypothetical protein [Candidatus Methylacidiphilales bacterium]